MITFTKSDFAEVYDNVTFNETTAHQLRISLQRLFDNDHASFEQNGVGKARKKGEVERNIKFERDSEGNPIPLGRYCLQSNDGQRMPFSKAEFRREFELNELPYLDAKVVGMDCCDAYLESYDDDEWVLSNKDHR